MSCPAHSCVRAPRRVTNVVELGSRDDTGFFLTNSQCTVYPRRPGGSGAWNFLVGWNFLMVDKSISPRLVPSLVHFLASWNLLLQPALFVSMRAPKGSSSLGPCSIVVGCLAQHTRGRLGAHLCIYSLETTASGNTSRGRGCVGFFFCCVRPPCRCRWRGGGIPGSREPADAVRISIDCCVAELSVVLTSRLWRYRLRQ